MFSGELAYHVCQAEAQTKIAVFVDMISDLLRRKNISAPEVVAKMFDTILIWHRSKPFGESKTNSISRSEVHAIVKASYKKQRHAV